MPFDWASSAKIRQRGLKHSFVILSCSCSETVSAPHLLIGLRVGTILNQSIDNLRVPIPDSPDQGSPAPLRDDHMSGGCSLALSDKTVVIMIGFLRDKFGLMSKTDMHELLTY